MVSRYVLVSTDSSDKVIKGGPVLWDGSAAWSWPAGQTPITEADAAAQGYSFPPPSAADANGMTLHQRAASALAANVAYLALSSPTAAQVSAQVGVLTKECTALIRLALGLLDSTAGS